MGNDYLKGMKKWLLEKRINNLQFLYCILIFTPIMWWKPELPQWIKFTAMLIFWFLVIIFDDYKSNTQPTGE